MQTGYIIIQSNDLKELTEIVQSKQKEGWDAVGGFACNTNPILVSYLQPMVLNQKEPTKNYSPRHSSIG